MNTLSSNAHLGRADFPSRSVAYLAVFAGALVVTALSLNLTVAAPLTAALLFVAGLALVANIPAFARARLWVLSMILGVAGLYAMWRVLALLPLVGAEQGAGVSLLEQYTYYTQSLHLGLMTYRQQVFPLTLEDAPELRLLVATVWYVVAWGACFLGVSLRRPILGMGVLGAMIGTACVIDAKRGGLWPALCYLILLGTALALTRRGFRGRLAAGSTALGVGLSAVAALLALGLLTVAPTLAVPGVPQAVAWDPLRQTTGPEIVFNWRQNYPLLLDPGRNYPIMRVTSPVPTYWRANVLDVFTGDSWISRGTFLTPVDDVGPIREIPLGEQPVVGRAETQTFQIDGVHTSYLFSGGYPTQLRLDLPVRVYSSSAMALRAEKSLGPRFEYSVDVVIPQARPQDLVGLGGDYPEAVATLYLDLPIPTAAEAREAGGVDREWVRQVAATSRWIGEFQGVYELNNAIVGDADDPYQVALRIERHLRTSYRYTLQPPSSELRSPYAAFLLDTRQGFCQHFAGAMVLLLRLNDIPARVAVGFVTGEEVATNVYQVTTNNAHAWVEAYFPGYGWLSFDPTPGRSVSSPGVSLANAGFADPYPEQPSITTSTVPAEDGRVPESQRLPEEGGVPEGDGTASAAASGRISSFALVLLGLVGVAVAWPAGVALRRQIATRVGPPSRRLRATARRVVADLKAWGIPVPPAFTLDEVAGLTESRLGVDIRWLAQQVQTVAFGGGEANEEAVRGARRLSARVRRRLRATRGWSLSLRAWYGIPVSTARVTADAVLGERRGELLRKGQL